MKSLQQCVDERMSIRKYKDKDITRKILTQLVLNASKAPSGSNIQPWEFVIVDDPTLLSKLTNYAPGIISLPPAIIAVCVNRIRAAKGGQLGPEMAVLDVAMATQVLILSAVDKGLGTCVIKSFQPEIINRILSLPDHVSVEILITVGIPQELPRRMPKRHSSEFIHYNLWARHEF